MHRKFFLCWEPQTNNHSAANVIQLRSRWEACDLSEGVSQVTVNDPVVEMLLLIKKFTYLVAEGQDSETKSTLARMFWIYGKKMHTSASSYAQFGFLGQHQKPLFIKLDHAPNLQQLQQNLHRTSCCIFTTTVTIWLPAPVLDEDPLRPVELRTCCLSVWRESSSGQHRNSRTWKD